VKYPGKEMNMEVHGTITKPLATKFKRTSVVFWEGVDAQYEREVYSASKLLRSRPLAEVRSCGLRQSGKLSLNDKVNAKRFSNELFFYLMCVPHHRQWAFETILRIIHTS